MATLIPNAFIISWVIKKEIIVVETTKNWLLVIDFLANLKSWEYFDTIYGNIR